MCGSRESGIERKEKRWKSTHEPKTEKRRDGDMRSKKVFVLLVYSLRRLRIWCHCKYYKLAGKARRIFLAGKKARGNHPGIGFS